MFGITLKCNANAVIITIDYNETKLSCGALKTIYKYNFCIRHRKHVFHLSDFYKYYYVSIIITWLKCTANDFSQ